MKEQISTSMCKDRVSQVVWCGVSVGTVCVENKGKAKVCVCVPSEKKISICSNKVYGTISSSSRSSGGIKGLLSIDVSLHNVTIFFHVETPAYSVFI